jgi:dihydropteroate synthase
VATGFPVVIGTSRKSFLGTLAPQSDGAPAPPLERLEATVATTTWAMVHGAAIVRVHDVAPAVQAAYLVNATAAGSQRPPTLPRSVTAAPGGSRP